MTKYLDEQLEECKRRWAQFQSENPKAPSWDAQSDEEQAEHFATFIITKARVMEFVRALHE